MKIAIMGTRGVPANYGGFETFAEQLGSRLAARGHQVTIYCRKHYSVTARSSYKGIELVTLPTIKHKYFDTVVHTFLSVMHSMSRPYDVVLICNAANSIFSFIPRMLGTPTLVNVDGLERKRKKWNVIGKAYYKISERLSTFLPTAIVTDATVIKEYYAATYNKESEMIAYGADVQRRTSHEKLTRYGLKSNRYVLYVSRLEPENNAHLVIDAYKNVNSDMPLVIVGGAPYAQEYIDKLKRTDDKRVKFLGFIYGDDYKALQQNAYCYVHATEVGGTHPALIEAMGAGNCTLTYATGENMEVVGDAAISFDSADTLTTELQRIIDNPALIDEYRSKAMERVKTNYNWEYITDQYERLLGRLAGLPVSFPSELRVAAHKQEKSLVAKSNR